MIVNRKVIQDEILRQTLQQQINRLSFLYNSRQFNVLEQKLHVLQNDVQYASYNYNKKVQSMRSLKEHTSRMFSQAMHEKKIKDSQQRQLIQYNRRLLAQLQKTRRQVADQRNKNNDVETKSAELSKQEKNLQQKNSDFIKKIQEQLGWIKRLKAAEKLCKREASTLKQNIEKVKAQIKIENIGNKSIKESIQQIKKQIKIARNNKQSNYIQIQKQKILLQQQEKNVFKQSQELKNQRQQKIDIVKELQNKHQYQSQEILNVNLKIRKNEENSHELECKIVKNMNLIQEVNNQLFETKVNQTNAKGKMKQLMEKIHRLKNLKSELFDLIY